MTHLIDVAIVLIGLLILGAFLLSRRKSSYKPQFYEAGPWFGMRDSLETTTASPDRAQLIQNAYIQDPSIGGGVVGRPGFTEITDAATGSKAQCLYDWVRPADGALYSILVSSGEIYLLNNGGMTSTAKAISTADLTGESITLSATARVSIVSLGTVMVISDGVNTPFSWTGAASSGLTKLTNCPVLYGPPTIYYSKLFGIKASDRTTFVWSEENDPTLGYDTAPYNNAWDFTQIDHKPLTALLGTNEALYVFRPDSITEITGAVNDDFQTAGTRASVSETVGTVSPWSVIYSKRGIFFLDNVGRPQFFRISGEVIPIWRDFRETVKLVKTTEAALADAITVEYTPANLILFGVTESDQTYPSMMMVFHWSGGDPIANGVWRGFTFTAMGMITYSSILPEALHHAGPTDGNVYRHGLPSGSTWTDNGSAITHIVKCTPMAVDPSGEKFFDRLDWMLPSTGITQTMSYDYVTPRGTSTAQTPGAATKGHQALGINAHGRWISPRVTHSTSGEQFGVMSVRVRGVITTDAPSNV